MRWSLIGVVITALSTLCHAALKYHRHIPVNHLQPSLCDVSWKHWKPSCYEKFDDEKLAVLQKRETPITIWAVEIHRGMRQELERLPSLLSIPIRIVYKDMLQLVRIAKAGALSQKCPHADVFTEAVRMNLTQIYYKDLSLTCNVWRNCPRPRFLRRQFYSIYTSCEEALSFSSLMEADVLYFSAPSVLFELFMPFDLPMVVQVPYGFEMGRDVPESGNEYFWDTIDSWLASSSCVGCKTKKLMATQSLYDTRIMQYLSGQTPPRLPIHGIVLDQYHGHSSDAVVVTFGSRGYSNFIESTLVPLGSNWPNGTLDDAIPGLEECKYSLESLRKPFTMAHLGSYKAMVMLPYKPAINFFIEAYGMNMPIFVPSVRFFCELDKKYFIDVERIRYGGIPASNRTRALYAPNDTSTFESCLYWNSFADHYTYPYVTQFDSWKDMVAKVNEADFAGISAKMKAFNLKRTTHIANKWLSFLWHVAHERADDRSKHWQKLSTLTFDQQVKATFDITLARDEQEDVRQCMDEATFNNDITRLLQ